MTYTDPPKKLINRDHGPIWPGIDESSVMPLKTRLCSYCHGDGYHKDHFNERHEKCGICGGTGNEERKEK